MDVIGQAHTGTGKTAAFALPILSKVKSSGPIQALVLVPTRELAVQVSNEINKFAKYTGIRTIAIYGGQSISLQYTQLERGAHVVVATPGRLIDHMKHGSIKLDDVNFVVLDEADRMLDMGFIDDIRFIFFYLSEDNRQTCLFSATMPPEIMRLTQEYMHDVKEIRLNEDEISLDTIAQSYLIVHEKQKFNHLCNFIKKRDGKQTIVFAATKQRAQRLVYELNQNEFKAISIHGDLSQRQRDNAMYRFKKGVDAILVATDIAARGIDVPAVGHVINYDIPGDPLIYFHRIGRTARAGATGSAISLVSQDRVYDFDRILSKTQQPIHKLNEELGIAEPVAPQISYDRYQQQRRSYWDNNRYKNGSYSYGNNRNDYYRYREHQGNGSSSSSSSHSHKRYMNMNRWSSNTPYNKEQFNNEN